MCCSELISSNWWVFHMIDYIIYLQSVPSSSVMFLILHDCMEERKSSITWKIMSGIIQQNKFDCKYHICFCRFRFKATHTNDAGLNVLLPEEIFSGWLSAEPSLGAYSVENALWKGVFKMTSSLWTNDLLLIIDSFCTKSFGNVFSMIMWIFSACVMWHSFM